MADNPVSPASEEAETGLICSAFLDPKHTLELCLESDLRAEHFFYPTNATYFALLLEFWQDNEPIEDVTFQQVLRDRGGFDQMGGRIKGEPVTGAAFFTAVRIFIGTAYHAANYIEIVKEKAMRRMINLETSRISGMAMDSAIEMGDIYSRVEATMMKVMKAREGVQTHSRSIGQLVTMALDQFEAKLSNTALDMPSGIPCLDFYTDGLIAPEVTFIQSKPSDGKTAISLNITEHAAVECGKRVGYISLEMGDIQLVNRLIFSRARINPRTIKQARRIEDWENEAIVAAGRDIAAAPIFIRDDGGLTVAEIGATATAWKARHGLDLLIIDHLQLAKGGGKHKDRTEEVEFVSNAMKPMAKRLEIPIIVLSQVTEGASGEYKIKQSRAAEADADNIWTISHTREKDETGKAIITGSCIFLSKQRDRDRDIPVHVIFDPTIQRFSEKPRPQTAEQPDLANIPPAKKGRK